MSAEYQVLERKHQRLDPQDQCMHKCERIDDVKNHAMQKARTRRGDRVVVIRIGIGDAAATGRHIIDAPFV